MLSRDLWRSLNAPLVSHPLSRLLPRAPKPHTYRNFLLTIFVGFPVCTPLCLIWITISVENPLLLATIPFILPLLVNVRVCRWAISAAGAISGAWEQGRRELVSVLPTGAFNVSWTFYREWLYQTSRLHLLKNNLLILLPVGMVVALVIILFLVEIVIALVNRQANSATTIRNLSGFIDFLIPAGGMLLFLYTDCIQSIVLSAVLGMAGAAFASRSTDARLIAGLAFAVIQALLYGITILVGYVLLPSLYRQWNWQNLLSEISLVLVRFVLLCGGRELVLIVLWRRLIDQLGGEAFATGA